jgi:hypothetical protein
VILLDPISREPLGELPGETAFNAEQKRRALAAAHWRPGWRTGMTYENGIPVRMWFAECHEECCVDAT